jgi:hypothetical protein
VEEGTAEIETCNSGEGVATVWTERGQATCTSWT